MLFKRRALTFYQRYATLKIRRRILFHFQRRINVISTLIHNVETTLIRRWNVGWVWCNVLWSVDWYFLASDNFQGTFCFMVSTQVLMEELAISWSMFANSSKINTRNTMASSYHSKVRSTQNMSVLLFCCLGHMEFSIISLCFGKRQIFFW